MLACLHSGQCVLTTCQRDWINERTLSVGVSHAVLGQSQRLPENRQNTPNSPVFDLEVRMYLSALQGHTRARIRPILGILAG